MKTLTVGEQMKNEIILGILLIMGGVSGSIGGIFAITWLRILEVVILFVTLVFMLRLRKAKKEKRDEMAEIYLLKAERYGHYVLWVSIMIGLCIIAIFQMVNLLVKEFFGTTLIVFLVKTMENAEWYMIAVGIVYILLGIDRIAIGLRYKKLEAE